jgi:uncharacterized membrane protein
MTHRNRNTIVKGLCFVVVCISLAVVSRYGFLWADADGRASHESLENETATAQNISSALSDTADNSPLASTLTDNAQNKYSVKYNENGAILRSDSDTIYLGNSCEAVSKKFGKGTWRAANAGLLIEFNRESLGFYQQGVDLKCPEKNF